MKSALDFEFRIWKLTSALDQEFRIWKLTSALEKLWILINCSGFGEVLDFESLYLI